MKLHNNNTQSNYGALNSYLRTKCTRSPYVRGALKTVLSVEQLKDAIIERAENKEMLRRV